MLIKLLASFKSRLPSLASYLFFERPLKRLSKDCCRIISGPSCKIPQVVYQTWDSTLFGRTHFSGLTKFRRLNPEYDFHIFSSDEMDGFMCRHYGDQDIYDVYKCAQFPAMRADIWRYCIVYKFGGFYFDINKCVSAPLLEIINNQDIGLISFENNLLDKVRACDTSARLPIPLSKAAADILIHSDRPILNWGFGFAAGHPFLEQTINNIVAYAPQYKDKIFTRARDPIIELTGPNMFTRSIYQVLDKIPDVPFRQLDIDFNGLGDPNMDGSWVRYATSRSYVRSKDAIALT